MVVKVSNIPNRLKNPSKEHPYVAGAVDIVDDALGKPQSQVNQERIEDIAEETQRAQAEENLLQGEINALSRQNYVTVGSYSGLPDLGAVDTIYRVSNWDGTQVDATKYAEYAWNNTGIDQGEYVLLDVKTQVGEVFDISLYKAVGGVLAKFADLSAALDGGNNVPAGVRQGGMSIKFVESSDNNYTQFHLKTQSFSADPEDWYFEGDDTLVENPEFIRVYLDADRKIVKAIKKDGTEYLAAGLEVRGDINTDGADITLIESPEFFTVWIDKNEKILFGVQKDGNIYFGCGVPQQVIDYVEGRIEDLSLDEYEDIVAFLGDLITGDKTLAELLNEKVDKEEGKSLIDEEYAEGVHYIENPEFVQVVTDSEGRVTEGTKKDGTKVIGGDAQIKGNATVSGDATILGNVDIQGATYTLMQNPEWVRVIVDSQQQILCGIKADGSIYLNSLTEIPSIIQDTINAVGAYTASLDERITALESIFSIIDNPEYIAAETDSEGKILSGRNTDGSKFENLPMEFRDKVSIDGNVMENIQDPEGRTEIKTDAEGRILSYRDSEGVLHENVGINTPTIILEEEGIKSFIQVLQEAGFQGGGRNFSNEKNVNLPEPSHFGILNLILETLPTSDSTKGYVEYYDFFGNYFMKSCEVSPQGQSSKRFALTGGKGNYTLDITDGSEIKFGSWVPQDSFHLKGNYREITRGILATSYKMAYKVMNYLDAKPNRVLIDDASITTTNATGDKITDWPNDARCIPDGFPIEMYLNGEYWGLYSLQLKKHRKNYSMDKKDYSSFFIDADNLLTDNLSTGIWNEGPKRWWDSFEIKNPKDMILTDGSEYDDHGELISPRNSTFDSINWAYLEDYSIEEPVSDKWDSQASYTINDTCWCYDEDIKWWRKFKALKANQGHSPLTFEDNPVYNETNKKHKGSAKTKGIIQAFAKKYIEIKALVNANTQQSLAEAKSKFADYFDINACMSVYIFNCLMNNGDSIKKNTLWGVYNNEKIVPMFWDLDGMYGIGIFGECAKEPSAALWNGNYATAEWPLALFWQLYNTEIVNAYAELRQNGIISMNTWRDVMYKEWVDRIGPEAYDRDLKKWPETPSYRENLTNVEYWREDGFTYTQGALWDENESYSVGNITLIRPYSTENSIFMRYIAVKASDANNPQCPVTGFYDGFPTVGGFYDSPKRMEKWMESQLSLCDIIMGYTE